MGWLIGLTSLMVIGTYLAMIIFVIWAVFSSGCSVPGRYPGGRDSESPKIIKNYSEGYYQGVLGQVRLARGRQSSDGK